MVVTARSTVFGWQKYVLWRWSLSEAEKVVPGASDCGIEGITVSLIIVLKGLNYIMAYII